MAFSGAYLEYATERVGDLIVGLHTLAARLDQATIDRPA
jgi:hypothetical protein